MPLLKHAIRSTIATAALCLAPTVALALQITDSDGAVCTYGTSVSVGKSTKPAGAFAAGTRFIVAQFRCTKPGASASWRAFLYTFPPGSDTANHVESLPQLGYQTSSLIAQTFLSDPYVVGMAETANAAYFDPYHAFRYDIGSGVTQDLGSLGGKDGMSAAYGGAVDGSVVVGTSTVGTAFNLDPLHAFRWTPALGMQDLGAMMPGASSDARAANADGSVVVGGAFVAPGVQQAFRWTLSDPATGAGSFASLGADTQIALAVNADATVIVGKGSDSQAFRWTAAGVAHLGTLAGLAQAQATSVSDDGKVVVGIADNFVIVNFPVPLEPTSTQRAFRWTEATGMQYLGDALAAAGLDLSGVALLSADHVSADGQYISGTALLTGSGERVGYSVRYLDATHGASPPVAAVLDLSVAPSEVLTSSEADCLFNWAEDNYADALQPRRPGSLTWAPFYYRYYSVTNSYLGVSSDDNHIYYVDPRGNFSDLGLAATWSAQASCR